jgi:hypothetical protein
MTTQTYPSGFASATSDTYIPDNTLLGSEHPTQNYDMPANAAVAQYELVKLVGKDIVKIAADPAAGDVCGVVAWAADNLTATAPNLRSPKVDVYRGGEFNDANLIITGSTADAWRAVASGSGITFRKVLSFPS